ncbi:MAG: FIST signal transduction protein [Candidatus Binatia bacterium]
MKWASSASDDADLAAAIRRAAGVVRAGLGDCRPDLIVAFVSAHHAACFARLPGLVADELGAGLLIGCSAGGVIGGGREIEQRPGLSLTAAYLPGVSVTPWHLENDSLPSPTAADAAWRALIGVDAAAPHFIMLPEPFSFDAESLIRGLDAAYPGSTIIGGIASGAREPLANALFLGPELYRSGAVGLALTGNIQVDTVVAQGCRPIGDPMFVTSCERNVIRALDGRAPLEVLQELHDRLDERDRQLARHSLFLGIVMKEDRVEYRQGDFLIRNLIGIDPKSGALAIGALLDENAVVQFHLRDAHTSAQDLEAMLGRALPDATAAPHGALLFSCLGRGQFLYGAADHDTDAFRAHAGDVALGGFFCNGEIGPVHGTTFLHGYTSAFALFRSRAS